MFSKTDWFSSQSWCHDEEGFFPRCAELAPPSSKTEKACSTFGQVSWSIRRSISKSGCSLVIFLLPSSCSLRREQFTFWEHSQILERLNIQCTCGQDKSNLVCLQELKGTVKGGHLKALILLAAKRVVVQSSFTRVMLLPGVHAATSDEASTLCAPVIWGWVAESSLKIST